MQPSFPKMRYPDYVSPDRVGSLGKYPFSVGDSQAQEMHQGSDPVTPLID
jgi:hypothetical protein